MPVIRVPWSGAAFLAFAGGFTLLSAGRLFPSYLLLFPFFLFAGDSEPETSIMGGTADLCGAGTALLRARAGPRT